MAEIFDYEAPTLEELTKGTLTNGVWNGTGVFDTLMYAVNENLRGEYEKQRLVGSEYAQVYLGSMQAVLAQSVEFLIGRARLFIDIDLQRERLALDAEIQRGRLALDDRIQTGKLNLDITTQAEAQDLNDRIQTGKLNLDSKAQEEAQALNEEIQKGTLADKEANSAEQRKVLAAQASLYARQQTAYDDNMWQQLLTTQLQYQGMIFQDADNPEILNAALEDAVNQVVNKLTKGQITVT